MLEQEQEQVDPRVVVLMEMMRQDRIPAGADVLGSGSPIIRALEAMARARRKQYGS